MNLSNLRIRSLLFCILWLPLITLKAQNNSSRFKVIAFYTAKNDQAHISFVHEANKWGLPDNLKQLPTLGCKM